MDAQEMITRLLSYFVEQRSLYKLLFNTGGDIERFSKLMSGAYDNFINEWKQKLSNLSEEQIEMLYAFVLNGAAAIVRRWTLNDMKEPPEEIAKFIVQAATYGSNSFTQ